jgi:tetratricopeptide (TPR) repeat protein
LVRGAPRDGRALIEPLLAARGPDEASPERAALHAVLARLWSAGGEYAASLAASDHAAALARAAGDDRTLALARAMPYPYAEARLRHACAQMHHQRGELESARVHLEAALALFRRLGARRDAAQVDQALASLSQNPSPSQNTSPSSLEPQVTETQWAQIADDRRVVEAILYKQRTGCAWAALPAELGDEATAHRRWREWQAAGLWVQIAAIAQAPPAPTDGRPAETGVPPPVEGG